MRGFIVIIFLLNFKVIFGQNCNCKDEYNFALNLTETNLPAYFDQVVDSNRIDYLNHRNKYIELSTIVNTERECISVITRYLSFFKDGHLSLRHKKENWPIKSSSDTLGFEKLNKGDAIIKCNIDSLSKNSKDKLEGIWDTESGNYTIGIVANKSNLWDYAGFIINADSLVWKKNHIKFEIKIEDGGKYSCLNWNGNRMPEILDLKIVNDSTLIIGRNDFVFYKYKQTKKSKIKSQKFENKTLILKKLSKRTAYLAIPNFLDRYKPQIDSLVGNNQKLLKSIENLIIDVRYNGGGNSPSLDTLIPLIYTNKIKGGCCQEVASIENLKSWEIWRDSVAESRVDIDEANEIIDKIKLNMGKLIPCEPEIYSTKYDYPNIKKVAILENKGCASTTEAFLYFALQSKKTTIYGDNSHGGFVYGNVDCVNLKNLPYCIRMASNKTGYDFKFEMSGIPPDVYLDVNDEKNWVNDVFKIIETN